MVELRKMLNRTKYRLIVGIFLFLFSPSISLAINYGSGLYGDSLYSSTTPSAIATPTSGTYTSNQLVILSTEGSNIIRYGTTGTPSGCSSGTLYTTPIAISSTTTLYTLVCDTYGNSASASFIYVISKTSPTVSSGSSVLTRYNNLIKNGNIEAARQLAEQFPAQIPSVVQSITQASINTTRTLRQGMEGDDIKNLQTYLNTHGYSSGTPDGSFGPITLNAVIRFQSNNELNPDGVVGPKTMGVITKISNNNTTVSTTETTFNANDSHYVFSKSLKLGSDHNDITEVNQLQKYLNTHGYIIKETGINSPGNETYYYGVSVRAAVIKLQMSNNLTPDGIFGTKTREMVNEKI